MTARDIERDMKAFLGGGSFITPGQIAKYTCQKNTSRAKKYTKGAFKLEGTNKYFVPDVARTLYESGEW